MEAVTLSAPAAAEAPEVFVVQAATATKPNSAKRIVLWATAIWQLHLGLSFDSKCYGSGFCSLQLNIDKV
jgi:hypothetical protein